jgi:hypothetical protein
MSAATIIQVDYLTNKSIRENPDQWRTPHDFVNWCISHSAYFVVSQGVWLGMLHSGVRNDGWTVTGIKKALKVLGEKGNGFPSALQLDCPIWNGDKFRYIEMIPELAIPTIKVDFALFNWERYLELLGAIRRGDFYFTFFFLFLYIAIYF